MTGTLFEAVRGFGGLAFHSLRRVRPFHFGSVGRGAPRPLGLWISTGYDHSVKKPYLNVTLFGRYRGRVYAKDLRP